MINDKDRICNRIKENWFKESDKPRRPDLPADITFTIIGYDVKMHISANSVIKNMQDNTASFEGWALILKRWGKFENVVLSWGEPVTDTKKELENYQRFLFRVEKFCAYFYSWFSLDSNASQYLLKLKTNEILTLYVNQPHPKRKPSDPKRPEGILENEFVNSILSSDLMNIINARYLDRQLPVGLFFDDVHEKNSIFPHRKSAIDIWGLSKKDELILMELKTENNNTVGIISEILFYCYFMDEVRKGRFKYKLPVSDNLNEISVTKKVIGYLLSPLLHPLLDPQIITFVNSFISPELELHWITFDSQSKRNFSIVV
jgi:hypothetical protein